MSLEVESEAKLNIQGRTRDIRRSIPRLINTRTIFYGNDATFSPLGEAVQSAVQARRYIIESDKLEEGDPQKTRPEMIKAWKADFLIKAGRVGLPPIDSIWEEVNEAYKQADKQRQQEIKDSLPPLLELPPVIKGRISASRPNRGIRTYKIGRAR